MASRNVLHGCTMQCSYCNVRSLVEKRLKDAPKYARGMEPGLAERELSKGFKPGEWVFVGYMGDVACQPDRNVDLVMERIRNMPEVNFYFQSKSPQIFVDWITRSGGAFPPPNVTFGTTLETNRQTGAVSKAPPPIARFEAMVILRNMGWRLMVSVEPVMDFDLTTLAFWLLYLEPDYIFLGADNYNNGLPEPSSDKLRSLISAIKSLPNPGTTLIQKPGLERLLR